MPSSLNIGCDTLNRLLASFKPEAIDELSHSIDASGVKLTGAKRIWGTPLRAAIVLSPSGGDKIALKGDALVEQALLAAVGKFFAKHIPAGVDLGRNEVRLGEIKVGEQKTPLKHFVKIREITTCPKAGVTVHFAFNDPVA